MSRLPGGSVGPPAWVRGGPVVPSVFGASFRSLCGRGIADCRRAIRRGHMQGRGHTTERGASGLEYVAIIVIAALVAGAIFVALSPRGADVRAATCRAVGTILDTDLGCAGGGEGDRTAPPKDSDFQPGACTVSQSGE